ncbi:MAG: Txe/YoeB family addiction module toxin [Spirochaetaceae bacterium]
MSRYVKFHDNAWEDYVSLQSEDRKLLKKLNSLIKTSQRTPEERAEPLKGNLSGYYSKHITKKDVLVYTYDDDSITIIQCKFHYS